MLALLLYLFSIEYLPSYTQYIYQDPSLLKSYYNHPCIRDCRSVDGVFENMDCYYDFTVEYYEVLTRNCLECDLNVKSDCFLKHCIAANGINRPMKVVNRMLPGPSIQVCEGDNVIVNVRNNLFSNEATTLHWHGLLQKGTPQMDGIAFVTQCPISPNAQFEYRFKPSSDGTFWWHAHSSNQRTDGIFGSLIIRANNDPNANSYDYDLKDHVIVLNDWLNVSAITKYSAFVQIGGDEFPTGILVNGHGEDVLGLTNITTPLSVFFVKKGFRYRFRIINAGSQYCPLKVSVDNHKLTIIATDGYPVQPVKVTSFYILNGERVDFVLHANKEIKKYLIRIRAEGDCEDIGLYQTSVLSYENSLPISQVYLPDIDYSTSGPISKGLTLNPFNTKITNKNKKDFISISQLRSSLISSQQSYIQKLLGEVDKKIHLSLDMNLVKNPLVYDDATWSLASQEDNSWTSPQINNFTFLMPESPLLFGKYPKDLVCNDEMRSKCYSNNETFCQCLHIIKLDLNDIVEVIMADGGVPDPKNAENHVMHLHGHRFAVMAMEKLGNMIYMPELKKLDKQGKLKRNFVNPPLKDTVQVASGGYTIFRFQADNPGVWAFHCHVENHSESGMLLVFEVGDSNDLPPKPKNWPTCHNFKSSIYSKDHHNNKKRY